ncbi:hypothetical protein AGIG_G21082 [Arapaima gigas]
MQTNCWRFRSAGNPDASRSATSDGEHEPSATAQVCGARARVSCETLDAEIHARRASDRQRGNQHGVLVVHQDSREKPLGTACKKRLCKMYWRRDV